jgi:hypothetical protein
MSVLGGLPGRAARLGRQCNRTRVSYGGGMVPAQVPRLEIVLPWLRKTTGKGEGDLNMEETLHGNSQARGPIIHFTLARGIGWGLVGGLAGTMSMDFVLMGALSAFGLPTLTCFSIVGNTMARFFSTLGLEMAGGVPAGVTAHYLIGPVVGAIFGAAVARIDALRVDTLKKGMLLAILYVEILSQPILAMTPILLKMTAPETVQWFGGALMMHLICGIVLGAVVSYGLRLASSRLADD